MSRPPQVEDLAENPIPASPAGTAELELRSFGEPQENGTSTTGPAHIVDRSQLQLIIAGLTDGVILVEADQSLTWANEAALAMHGVDRLEALGADVEQYRKNFQLTYRNNHPLENGRYPIERVVAGEAFDDVIVEVTPAGGNKPQWVHRIRSLVINDANGVPDCLVLILKDATDRFQAEERFQRAFNANPAPAVICRLSDLRYVKVNQGFLEMTGYRREELLGRSTYEIDLFQGAEKRHLAIERLASGETIPQMEAQLDLPSGGSKWVIVAGQPIEIGDEACMLFTFADLEPQKKAETALRHSEEQFEKAFRVSPAPTALLKLADFSFLSVNDAFTRLFKLAEIDVIGRRMDELNFWVDPKAFERFKAAAIETGAIRETEECLHCGEGDIDSLIAGVTVTIADEPCLLCTILDITERKRSERELVAAIDKVMADTSWFSRGLIEKLAELRSINRRDSTGAAVVTLTKRERQVLQFICQGLPDSKIADHLKVSPNTVRNHVAALYKKLQVHNRTEAALWGHANGFRPDAPAAESAKVTEQRLVRSPKY